MTDRDEIPKKVVERSVCTVCDAPFGTCKCWKTVAGAGWVTKRFPAPDTTDEKGD